jgi:hypothetical protein
MIGKKHKLPEAEEGDINYILNKMPKAWDLRTPFGMCVLEKMRDVLIDEVNKVSEDSK